MKFFPVGDRSKGAHKGHWGLITILAAAFIFMTAISLEQARIIEVQRRLIRQFFQDSRQLSAVRLHQVARHGK
jgi:predicted outer membrane lipoprotein